MGSELRCRLPRPGRPAALHGATCSVLLACCLLLDLVSTAQTAGRQDTHNPLERINVVAIRAPVVEFDSGAWISVNATVLGASGEWFNVAWHISNPSYGDWIGLWVPAEANMSATAPAKYKLAAESPTHIYQGRGSLTFRLISYRHDMVFALMRGGLLQPSLVARSPVIRVRNPNQPLHGHLALTGDNTEMLVQWNTFNSSRPIVKWGSEAGHYTQRAAARSHSYRRDEMCGGPAAGVGWVNPGLMHVAKLVSLVPGQKYFYVYGDEEWGFSVEKSFRAAPPVGPDVHVKVLAVADMGQGEPDGSMEQSEMLPSLNTTRLLQQQGDGYQLLVHNGDISYARGYVTQWDNYMHQIEPIVTRMPYMVAPGNHERDWPSSNDGFNWGYDSGGECGVPYERRLVMPAAGLDRPWYSFEFGPIHFLQYSTEHEFREGSEQHAFILADLAAVNRSRTPWLVVGGHRPFYICSNNRMQPDGDQPVAAALRDTYEQLFAEYRVDLTLHGHHHSYQRTCPTLHGRCIATDTDGSAGAPVHLVIGNAGASLTLNVDWFPAPIWKKIHLWFGLLRMEADGRRLVTEMVSDASGSPVDRLELRKPPGWGDAFMSRLVEQRRLGAGTGAVPAS